MATRIKLGELCHVVTKGTTPTSVGLAFSESGVPFLRIQNLGNRTVDLTDVLYIDDTTNLALNRSRIQPKDFLITIAGTIGKVAIIPDDFPECNCNQAVAILRFDYERLEPHFLLHWLATNDAFSQISGRKVTATISNLSLGQIKELKIPLPPLAEQKKITVILDAADSLRQKDQQLIDHYTTLSQSLFLEMFGSIFVNPNSFLVCKLETLLKNKKDMVDGPFGSSVDTKVDYCSDGEIPVIRTKNISKDNKFIEHDLKFMRREKYETIIRSQVLPNDIVLTKVGTIGNVSIMPDTYSEYVLSTTGSCRIRINQEVVNNKYFLHYLNFYKPKMLDIASAGVQAFLNMKHIKGFDVMCPPITLQNQFADRIQAIEAQKQQAEASLVKSNDLFNSLLQSAFKGEL